VEGSSGQPKTNDHFAADVRAAYATATATDDNTFSHSAPAWEAFALKVETMDAGSDARKQGLIVSAAKQAAAAYQSQVDASHCATKRYLNGGPSCAPTSSPASALRELRALVNSL
jgi:phosphodiesterase/alkaline phosphatase D-like protein